MFWIRVCIASTTGLEKNPANNFRSRVWSGGLRKTTPWRSASRIDFKPSSPGNASSAFMSKMLKRRSRMILWQSAYRVAIQNPIGVRNNG
jgi:hypothetical protein